MTQTLFLCICGTKRDVSEDYNPDRSHRVGQRQRRRAGRLNYFHHTFRHHGSRARVCHVKEYNHRNWIRGERFFHRLEHPLFFIRHGDDQSIRRQRCQPKRAHGEAHLVSARWIFRRFRQVFHQNTSHGVTYSRYDRAQNADDWN